MPHAAKDSSTSTANSDILTNPTSVSSLDYIPSPIDKFQPGNVGIQPQRVQRLQSNAPPPLSPAVGGSFKAKMDSPSPTSMSGFGQVQPLHSPVQSPTAQTFEAERQRRASKATIQRFEDNFSYKEHHESSSVDKIRRESPVIAELRTNVIVKDEYSLVTELSSHMSTRFQRPESCIMITVTHTACLMLGGSFEPAYLLNISAIEPYAQSSSNKRNASLVQGFLSEVLSVPMDRGVVRFTAMREDCVAMNGRTIQGEVDRIEGEGGSGIKKAFSKDRRKSTMSMRSRSNSTASKAPDLPSKDDKKKADREKRKSFISISGRKSNTDEQRDRSKSISKRRMSLHPPPNMMSESPSISSSGSSTPAVPNTMYLEAKGNDHKNRSRSPSKVDPTAKLLSQASHALSQHVSASSSALNSPKPSSLKSSIKSPSLKSPMSPKPASTQTAPQAQHDDDSDNSKRQKAQQQSTQPSTQAPPSPLPTDPLAAQSAGRPPGRSRQQSLPQPPSKPASEGQPLPPKPFGSSGSSPNPSANGASSTAATMAAAATAATAAAGARRNNGQLPAPNPAFSNHSRPASANRYGHFPPPPPEPASNPVKVSRRKSFIALFKRGDQSVKAN